MFDTDNYPNAAKLMDSLRYLGYNNYSAICDIIDNAFDAEAKKVQITISQISGEPSIIIADDGGGMDRKTLDEALKLGSLTERNAGSDLGKYGMGLVTASLSIAKRTTVLTRSNGSLLKSITDVDEVKLRNAFCKFLGSATLEDVSVFNKTVDPAGTGTIVELSKCDNLKNTNLSVFRGTLKTKLGQVYRYFLLSGKKIFINGEEVAARDPLMIDEGAEIYSDDRFDVTVRGNNGQDVIDQIRVRMAVLPDFGADGNKERKIGMRSQGFYILRNNREIADGETLGLFARHNDYNRFRGEIFFSGGLDESMGVNFTKRDVDPTQGIRDKLAEVVQGQLRTIRNRIKSARVTSEDAEITHDESEKLINAKSHLLIKPKTQKSTASNDDGASADGPGPGPKRGKGESATTSKSHSVPPRHNVRFEGAKLGKTGPIYEAEQVGKVTVIQWNIDHPFYERFVLERKDDKTLRTSVDFLVYSMATAELTTISEDNYEMIQNIKTVMSSNLRSLLS
jgi:hypothetical protein